MAELIKPGTRSTSIYISDADETAPASRAARLLLWILLAASAVVVIFLP